MCSCENEEQDNAEMLADMERTVYRPMVDPRDIEIMMDAIESDEEEMFI